MSNYQVEATVYTSSKMFGLFDIEAESQEEAEKIVKEKILNGELEAYSEVECMIEDVFTDAKENS